MDGNGSTKFRIAQRDMGGWVRVWVDEGQNPPDLPVYLSHALSNWLRSNPHLRCWAVVPIQFSGDTVELHAWYERTIFPDTSPLAERQQG
jgi:hypothetical protein